MKDAILGAAGFGAAMALAGLAVLLALAAFM